jgi:hypothetical protein
MEVAALEVAALVAGRGSAESAAAHYHLEFVRATAAPTFSRRLT